MPELSTLSQDSNNITPHAMTFVLTVIIPSVTFIYTYSNRPDFILNLIWFLPSNIPKNYPNVVIIITIYLCLVLIHSPINYIYVSIRTKTIIPATNKAHLLTDFGDKIIFQFVFTFVYIVFSIGVLLLIWIFVELSDTIAWSIVWISSITGSWAFGILGIDTEDPVFDINSYLSKYKNMISYYSNAQNGISDANQYVENGYYAKAIDQLEYAESQLNKAIEISKSINHQTESLRDDHSNTIEKIDETRKRRVKEDINNVKSKNQQLNECISNENYRKANNLLNKTGSKLDSIKRYIDQHELNEFYEEIYNVKQDYDSIVANDRFQAHSAIVDTILETELVVVDAKKQIQEREVTLLQQNLNSVKDEISIELANAYQHDLADLHYDLIQLDKEIEALLDEISGIRREQRVRRANRLQSELSNFSSKLNSIDNYIEHRSLNEARTKLQKIAPEIRSTKQEIKRGEFDDLEEAAKRIEEQRRKMLKEVVQLIRVNTKPDTIPQAPEVPVEYNKLTNKEPIGGGGNADVTKATLPSSTGKVTLAIKEPRMDSTLQADVIERILEEAKTWNRLDGHQYIVSVVDYGDVPIPWIAMEYMDAGHLKGRSGKLELTQAMWTSIAITKGVRHAHRKGVAHLDLKPENVLFRSVENGWDVPKVADWGLSKRLLNHSKSVEGLSPQYAAPEQFDDGYGSTDEITDIYQLGAVFYELFTGQPHFDGKPPEVMHKVLHKEPTPPSEVADVPDKLDEILLTALAKEKDDRYDNIVFLRDELQELFENW